LVVAERDLHRGESIMRKKRRTPWVVAVVVLAVGGLWLARYLRPVDVVVTPVVRGHVVDAVYATGTVEAERRVTVKAKVAGPVAELPVTEGDPVRLGQLLARIDNPAAAFDLRKSQVEEVAAAAQAGSQAPQIASLRAKAEALETQLRTAEREADRAEQLFKSGAIGQAESEKARDQAARLRADLEAQRAEERTQRINLDANAGRARAATRSLATKVSDAEVRAPVDGMVLARYVESGEVVAVNQSLFKVGDPKSLLLEVTIDEADVGRVHDGSDGQPASRVAATLHAFPGRAFGGNVVKVMPDADREKKSYLAKVRLDEPPTGLRSGMTAEVNIIITERGGVLLAPADAIKDGQVWRVSGGRAEHVPVTVGIHDLLRAEVLSGLSEGEQVAIGGIDNLGRSGARVRATVHTPDPLAGKPESTSP
jgi:HlyD family secretion protein